MMKNNRKNGFSLIELLIVVAIILIIAAIAIPNLIRSKMAANEASAVGSLRTMNTAITGYASTYDIGYPGALSYLGPSTAPNSTASDFIDEVLASGVTSGYMFTYTPGSASTGGVITNYSITASPQIPGASGQRYFYTDESLVIRVNTTAAASSTDSPL